MEEEYHVYTHEDPMHLLIQTKDSVKGHHIDVIIMENGKELQKGLTAVRFFCEQGYYVYGVKYFEEMQSCQLLLKSNEGEG